MAFDWTRFLVLAEELGRRRNDAAALRTAISRAYYAAFCSARLRLRQDGVVIPPTSAAHRVVWNHYLTANAQHRRAIGIAGERLRRARNQADYDSYFPQLAGTVRLSLARARRLIAALHNPPI